MKIGQQKIFTCFNAHQIINHIDLNYFETCVNFRVRRDVKHILDYGGGLERAEMMDRCKEEGFW
jgi:hypothetical protein